jgi:hypothetical protein
MSKYHRRPPSFQQLPGIPQAAHGLKVRVVTHSVNRMENKTGGLSFEMAHNGTKMQNRDYREKVTTSFAAGSDKDYHDEARLGPLSSD